MKRNSKTQTPPLPRNLLREQIRDLLVRRIGAGELKPGDRIVEAQLVQELRVSTIPIREALRELEAKGVLESTPHCGVWVREVSLRETIDALKVKGVLESLAAREAKGELHAKLPKLRTSAAAALRAARKRDFAAFQEHNQRFHRAIVESSGNRVLLKSWEALAFDVRTSFIMEYLKSVDPVRIAEEHEPILRAIEAGDGRQTARMLETHSADLVRFLSEEKTDTDRHGPTRTNTD